MVKFERLDTEKSRKAIQSLVRARRSRRSYNTPEVCEALKEMFHEKCYICESKHVTSYNIEHLTPHQGNADYKYNWDNLFLSCSHCNNTKQSRHIPILDCSKVEVDRCISFHFLDSLQNENEILIEALDEAIETQHTCELLMEVYYGRTPQKKLEARIIRRELRRQLLAFKADIREYLEADEGDDKHDLYCKIQRELSNRSEYTAFERWLIWDNKEMCRDLLPLLEKLSV